MEGWRTIPLGEAMTFQRGFDITKEEQEDGPYPVFSSSGPKSCHAKFKVRGPGVVIGRKGTLGSVFYSDGDFWPHDTTLWVKDFHGNHPRFGFYFLQTMGFERLDAGASNPSLNRNHIHTISVRWPSKADQERIAGILSAYDELIENSQRRIRTLEGMARALYREWFVRYRFPGYEDAPLVASPLGAIPRGWGAKPVKDVADVTYGFPFRSKKFNTAGEGIPVIRIRDLLEASTTTFTDEPAELRYHVSNGDILVGMDGDFHMCVWSGGPALQNQRVAKFASRGEIGNFHLYLALELPIQTWNRSIVGTTVAHLGDTHIKAIQVPWPPAHLRAKAGDALEPISQQIIGFKRQIRNLRRTRDLLLPRLLSGEVSLRSSDTRVTPPNAASNVIPFPAAEPPVLVSKDREEVVEALLIAGLVRRFHNPANPSGRTRYTKLAYFAHRKVADDVTQIYEKKAAGPYSPWSRYEGPEGLATQRGYLTLSKRDRGDQFLPGPRICDIDRELSRYPVCKQIDWVWEKFEFTSTDDLELLSTVDFAAVDLRADRKAIGIRTIKDVIAANREWAPKLKRLQFSDDNLGRALATLQTLFPAWYSTQSST